jgi:hypothetical protein
VVEFIYFILIVPVYYRQCDNKTGLAFIQFPLSRDVRTRR